MRIGLDFDNTLVCYDHIFALESNRLGIMPADWSGSKQELKDKLLSHPDGDRLWQTLQGRVYGPAMKRAVMYPGVAHFLMRSRLRGDDLFIVSHKTEFGHFDSTRTPLRQEALMWMESNGFFEQNRFGLVKGCVFFADTRCEKVEQIAHLNLDIFIDDLEEVFEEEAFPPIKKVLFNVKAKGRHHDLHCSNWSEIAQQILGPMPDHECKVLAQTFCPGKIESVTQLPGRGNSRIYRVITTSGDAYALKSYPDRLIDSRPRLRTEVKACDLLEHLSLTPRSVAYNEELNCALFEWIDGETPRTIKTTHIDQALAFAGKLNDLTDRAHNYFPEASEACLSAMQLFSQVEGRIQRLESVDDLELQKFLKTRIKPLWEEIKDSLESKWPAVPLEKPLTQSKQTLSPSDFGFHNSLQQSDGNLCFVDLEYFGFDDPIKLIADFLWHPAMDLSPTHKTRWLRGMLAIFDRDPELGERFHAAWPAYGVRWALIMLNEYLHDGWQKRLHANPEPQQSRKQIQQRQMQKAAEICGRIREEKLECPYV